MYKGHRILAIVPARGGSKGIPLKNLLKLDGKSLIQHVANAISESSFVDRAVVSTDHPMIKEEALKSGLQVPFFRPDELSGDIVGDYPVLVHALLASEEAFAMEFDIVLMLQPTSPFRTAEHIRACVDHLVENNLDSVWTVSPTESKAHPLKQLRLGSDGQLSYFDEEGSSVIARQTLPPVFHRNGIAYAFTRCCLLEKKTLMTKNSSAVVIDDFYVNIDSWDDVQMAELFLAGQISNDPTV